MFLLKQPWVLIEKVDLQQTRLPEKQGLGRFRRRIDNDSLTADEQLRQFIAQFLAQHGRVAEIGRQFGQPLDQFLACLAEGDEIGHGNPVKAVRGGEIDDLLATASTNQRSEEIQRETLANTRRAFELADLEYREGSANGQELREAQRAAKRRRRSRCHTIREERIVLTIPFRCI